MRFYDGGEYGKFWSEAVSLKQSKRQRTNSIEEILVRAKTLCLQGQYGRAAKVSASEGLAPNNKATFKALEKLHPKEPLPDVSLPDDTASIAFQFSENVVYDQLKTFSKHTAAGPSKMFPEHLQHAVDCAAPDVSLPDDTASNAFQFSENVVYEQLKTFSKHTAAGPSKMFPEHLQHAVDCTAPDQSEFALKAITKFVNFGSRGLFPVSISKALCCASLTALSKKKDGVRPIAVGEVLRRLIAKCLASDAKSEAIELFDSLQLGVSISRGAEAIIHSSKITYNNIVSAQTDKGVLQIDFQNAFNSVK